MTEAPEYVEIPQEVQRDRYGRPLIIPPEGGKPVPYTRCTTYVGALEDTYNLGGWQQRMAVAGIAMRPDLHLRAVSLGKPPVRDGSAEAEAVEKKWKSEMNKLVDEAREAAAASASATIGTSLHSLTEVIDRGRDLDWQTIPERYRVHLTNYIEATRTMHPVAVERFVVNDALKVGGTADRFVTIEGFDGLFVADLKTGSVEYGAGKIAMQLAVYANSQAYDPQTGTRTPPPGIRRDLGVVIHLDAVTGTCQLLWADLATAWEAVKVAGWVREWRKRKNLLVPAQFTPEQPALIGDQHGTEPTTDADGTGLAPIVPEASEVIDPATGEVTTAAPPDATTVAIEQAITTAANRDDLARLWNEAYARGLWTDAMTEAANRRLSQLQATA